MNRPWKQRCVVCGDDYEPLEVRYRCDCGGTLDIIHDRTAGDDIAAATFDARLGGLAPEDHSGVWRYRELVLPIAPDEMIARGEGNTNLYRSPKLSAYTGVDDLALKHEGENPTGSFKDRGMTVAMSVAKIVGATAVACASTGNTSASLASYAAMAGLRAVVFVPAGKVSFGKLSQALAYGATTLEIEGDFDDTMRIVQEVCAEESIYLVNSINPFRIEGQKAILFELLQQRGWSVPDWIVLPGGNLGNSSAIAKGLSELLALGIIDRLPRIAVVQAHGANPLYRAFASGSDVVPVSSADTLATAIRIGDPVSWRKCLRGIAETDGVVTEVTDDQIMDAKAHVDASGIGAEPASCATVAGTKRLVTEGVIKKSDTVCGILTGHLLKDSDSVVKYHRGELEGITSTHANDVVPVASDLKSIVAAIRAGAVV